MYMVGVGGCVVMSNTAYRTLVCSPSEEAALMRVFRQNRISREELLAWRSGPNGNQMPPVLCQMAKELKMGGLNTYQWFHRQFRRERKEEENRIAQASAVAQSKQAEIEDQSELEPKTV